MENEKMIKNSPAPVDIAGTKTILNQMMNCICKIKINATNGTGFFCKIPYKNSSMKVLMTNYHVLDEKYCVGDKDINVLVNDEDKAYGINLLIRRKTYFNKDYDIAIIELKEEDGIKNFLELDENLFKDKENIFYEDKSLYVLQYPNGKNACVSYGLLRNIEKNDIKHTCSTEKGSSGSPILNLENNKVIGIHKEAGLSTFNFNKGTLLKFPINDFNEEQKNDRNDSNNENEKKENNLSTKLSKEIYQKYNKGLNLIWIDRNIHNNQNTQYIKEINSNFKFLKIKEFSNIYNSINYIRKILFESTKIIISGELYSEFVNMLKEIITDIYFAPKIIVLTSNKEQFYILNKDYHNKENLFYNYGGVVTTLQEIIKFLIDDIRQKKLDQNYEFKFLKNEILKFIKSDGKEYIFDYIDCNENRYLPSLYKSLLDNTSLDNLENYTALLFNKYSNNKQIHDLLVQIESMQNIPIEILSKYFVRLFSSESEFYKDINKDLRLGKIEKYLPYIKVLYEGLKLKSLELTSNNILYRGSKISFYELNKIKNLLNNKKEGLRGPIVFSKSLLTFTKSREISEIYLLNTDVNSNLIKAFFILEKDEYFDYCFSTYCDFEKISFYPPEKEVLLFPFSAFEIKELQEISIKNVRCYQIKLLYLGKYLKN